MDKKLPPVLSLFAAKRAVPAVAPAPTPTSRSASELPEGTVTITAAIAKARVALEGFGTVSLVGEVTRTTVRGGHWYLDLKDAQSTLAVVMYSRDNRGLAVPEPGELVCCQGALTIYAANGRFQMLARKLLMVGEGNAQKRLAALRDKLTAEGLFALERKRSLPLLPRRIGVVTSLQGAAIGDVLRVLAARAPTIPVLVAPTRVQGEGAAAEVAHALRRLDAHGGCDVILLVRGGGAADDLSAFNSEAVARAVFHARVPVVAGVGHQMDTTLTDLTADVRAATPSQAAELASPMMTELVDRVANLSRRLRSVVAGQLAGKRGRLLSWQQRLPAPAAMLRAQEQRLQKLVEVLQAHAPQQQMSLARARTHELDRRLAAHHPGHAVSAARERLDHLREALLRAMADRHRRAEELLLRQVAALDALSPLAVLQRGYAVVRNGKGQLQRGDELVVGELVDVRFAAHEAVARVEQVRHLRDEPHRDEAKRKPRL